MEGDFFMEYNRLVAYIYSYAEGIKGENAGFAKIEIRNDILKLRLTIAKSVISGSCKGSVYMYYRKNTGVYSIKLGEIEANNFGGEFEYFGNAGDIETSGISFEEICGMCIKFEEDSKYLFGSEWDELGFMTNLNHRPVMEVAEIEQVEEIIEEAEETLEETPVSNWRKIYEDRETVDLFADDNFYDVVEITPSDIERMPNSNWGLLTNSFVNYGYSMFRHLIMGSYTQAGEKKYFIGVPGVYNRRERLTASMYGFDHFKFSMRSDMRLSQFGYWYRTLLD